MSISVQSGSNSQDFELNLASIIDCFTVLIAFMLASASFLSIGILDAGIAAAGATASTDKPPEVNVTVELMTDHVFTVKVTGKTNSSTPVTAKDQAWDYARLNETLQGLRAKYPSLTAVTLTAQDAVEYKDIVKTMDSVRGTLPYVLLGGF